MYLGYQNDVIKFYTENQLDSAIYNIDRSVYTEDEYRLSPDCTEYVTLADYLTLQEMEFKKQFFNTSLGWVRRNPTLADGTVDDFLNNDLPLLAIALISGSEPTLPIAYSTPDFTRELTQEYLESLQVFNQPITAAFINECSQVKMSDFLGGGVVTNVINNAYAPSAISDILTFPTTANTQYEAPGNGWYFIQAKSTAANNQITIYNRTSGMNNKMVANGTETITVSLPVNKGDIVEVSMAPVNWNNPVFKFLYNK